MLLRTPKSVGGVNMTLFSVSVPYVVVFEIIRLSYGAPHMPHNYDDPSESDGQNDVPTFTE